MTKPKPPRTAWKYPPDLGAQLVTAIGTVARVAEVDNLTRRIAALEEKS